MSAKLALKGGGSLWRGSLRILKARFGGTHFGGANFGGARLRFLSGSYLVPSSVDPCTWENCCKGTLCCFKWDVLFISLCLRNGASSSPFKSLRASGMGSQLPFHPIAWTAWVFVTICHFVTQFIFVYWKYSIDQLRVTIGNFR